MYPADGARGTSALRDAMRPVASSGDRLLRCVTSYFYRMAVPDRGERGIALGLEMPRSLGRHQQGASGPGPRDDSRGVERLRCERTGQCVRKTLRLDSRIGEKL